MARVANTIFERTFSQDQVVGETLARSLDSEGEVPSQQEFTTAVAEEINLDAGEAGLYCHPVAIWLENHVALEECEGYLVGECPWDLVMSSKR